jgi:hypothetical protein
MYFESYIDEEVRFSIGKYIIGSKTNSIYPAKSYLLEKLFLTL